MRAIITLASLVVLAAACAPRSGSHTSAYHLALIHRDTSGVYTWTGPVQGAVTGRATVTLEFQSAAGPTPGAALIWTHWVVDATPASQSFEASLSGTGDIVAGKTHLVGTVIRGAGRGQIIETESDLGYGGPNGTLSQSDGAITILKNRCVSPQ